MVDKTEYDLSCFKDYAGERLLLTFSNFTMLFAIVVCIKKIVREKKKLYLELIVFTSLMLTSFFYHLCDSYSIPRCSGYCIMNYGILMRSDFALSGQYVQQLFLYISLDNAYSLKATLTAITLFLNAMLVDKINEFTWTLIIVISSIMFLIGRVLYTTSAKKFCNYFKFEIDWIDAINALVCISMAFVFRYLTYTDKYSINLPFLWNHPFYHSLWHIFAMFTGYIVLDLYDTTKSVFPCYNCLYQRCKRQRPPSITSSMIEHVENDMEVIIDKNDNPVSVRTTSRTSSKSPLTLMLPVSKTE